MTPDNPPPKAPDWRFPRQHRLLAAKDFSRVFAQPVKQGDRDFTLLARANGLAHARLGIAAPKRQLKRAVDRNRIKRIIRESFRRRQAQLRGLDVVVLVRHGVLALDNAALFRRLDKLWNSLSKKCEKQFFS
ncbi:MAG TPA: ribonuclease P protein component [Gammaproteobacteria bacterium]|nr:ribonuclease P protein component [Gammaproteobacteria bacterium]